MTTEPTTTERIAELRERLYEIDRDLVILCDKKTALEKEHEQISSELNVLEVKERYGV